MVYQYRVQIYVCVWKKNEDGTNYSEGSRGSFQRRVRLGLHGRPEKSPSFKVVPDSESGHPRPQYPTLDPGHKYWKISFQMYTRNNTCDLVLCTVQLAS